MPRVAGRGIRRLRGHELYNFDQQLVSDPNHPERDWGVFGRFGVADKDTSVIQTFTSIGLGGTGLIPGPSRDRFGVGYYYMTHNDDRIRQILPEDDIEIFYRLPIFPLVDVTLSYQSIFNPVLDPDNDHASTFGLRLRTTF